MQQPENILMEEGRFATFSVWPFGDDAKCNKRKMAEAGFYVKENDPGEDFSASCFVCGKSMDGWEIDDDPWQEHISHGKNCKFAQLGKAEKDLKLHELSEILVEHMKTQINMMKEAFLKVLEEKPGELETKIALNK